MTLNNIMPVELTPIEVASSFLEKWNIAQQGGVPPGPVFDRGMVQPILLSIRQHPMAMVSFFIQVGQAIKTSLDVAHGVNSKESVEALLEWNSVAYGFIIPVLSGMMESNAQLLDKHYPELLYGTDDVVPVPEGEASEVFKNLEGFNMDSWITPSLEDPEQEPPQT